jgi:hypothetical protein
MKYRTTIALSLALAASIATDAHAGDKVVHHQLTISSNVFGCTKPATTELGLKVSNSSDQGEMSKFVDVTFASGDCVGIPAGTTVTTGRGFPGDEPPTTMLVELSVPGHAAPLWVPMGLIAADMIGASK